MFDLKNSYVIIDGKSQEEIMDQVAKFKLSMNKDYLQISFSN